MRLLRWLFVLFALMYAPAQAQAADPKGGTPPVVTPSAGAPFNPYVVPTLSDPSLPSPTTPAAAPISGIDPKTGLPVNTAEPGVVSPTKGTPKTPDLTIPTLSPLPDAPGVTQPSIPGRPGIGGYPTPNVPVETPEYKRLKDLYPAPKTVLFPEASTIQNNSSICQIRRDQSFGNNTPLFNPGKTMENATAIYNALPCPTTWLAQTVKAISNAGLPGYISKLAFAVWFLGIIWTGVRIANGSERSEGRELFARLLISGWLVFGSATASDQLSEPKFSGNMGQFVRAAWVQAYTWGNDTFASPALERAAEQTANLGEHISRLVTLYASVQVLSEAAKEGVKGAVASTVTTGNPITGGIAGILLGGAGAAGNVVAATTQAGILAVNMVMPILLTYYLIITGTGLAAVIASMLLPLVGAMFVFGTGLGMQYAETWFRTVASAVLMMALMPVFFTASLELGFVEPARNFDRYTTRAETSLKADFDKITKLAKEGQVGWVEENWKKLGNVLQAFGNKFDVVGYLNSMLTSLVLMAFSLIAGMYTLRIAQNWIIEFLSGVASAITGGGGAPNFGKAVGAGAGAAGNASSAASSARVASNSAPKTGSAQASASVPKSSPSGNTPSLASAGSGAGVKPGAGATNGGTPTTVLASAGGGAGVKPGAGATNGGTPTSVGGNAPPSGGSFAPQQSAKEVGGGQGSNNIVATGGFNSTKPSNASNGSSPAPKSAPVPKPV